MRQMMSWRIAGLLGLAILGGVPLSCVVKGGGAGGTSGANNNAVPVGLACAIPAENNPQFIGYDLNDDVLIVGAPECGQGVCLVNHFQGAVSCPLGQAKPIDAQGLDGCVPELDAQGNYVSEQGSCKPGDVCAQAGSTYACHTPGSCQVAGATDAENAGKACCVPGTDIPYTNSVCGQCEGSYGQTTRDAENAVYCSCRCGVADGEPDDPDYPFCACPDGFECSEIRKNLGLGPMEMTGKYCVKADTAFERDLDQCGYVDGHWDTTCVGIGTGKCQSGGAPCDADPVGPAPGPVNDACHATHSWIQHTEQHSIAGASVSSLCLPVDMITNMQGEASCAVIEARSVGAANAAACNACSSPGRAPLPAVRQPLAAQMQEEETSAALDCFCEIEQVSTSSQVSSTSPCQDDASPAPVDSQGNPIDGFCYVADDGPGDPTLVEGCPKNQRRALRFVGAGVPTAGSTVYVVCTTDTFDPGPPGCAN